MYIQSADLVGAWLGFDMEKNAYKIKREFTIKLSKDYNRHLILNLRDIH